MPFQTSWAIAASVVALLFANSARSDDLFWRVSKVSGQAWFARVGASSAALTGADAVRPGDTVQTGRNGRVLIVRGSESMLIGPNSSVSLPGTAKTGVTTIVQQAGSILIEADRRDVEHFEVQTPYLAAVVKGTRFNVEVKNGQAKVDVRRGQVQVADYRSGQFALVSPGQTAQVSAARSAGLRVSGAGQLNPVSQGPAQTPPVAPMAVPPGGLKPSAVGGGSVPAASSAQEAGIVRHRNGSLKISVPLGETRLDIHRVTQGLATEGQASRPAGAMAKPSVWSTGELNGIRSRSHASANSGTISSNQAASSGGADTALAATAASGTQASSTGRGNAGLGLSSGASGLRDDRLGQHGGNNGQSAGNGGGNHGNGNGGGNNGNGNGNGGGNSGNGNGNGGSNSGNGNGNSGGNSGNGNGNGGGNSGNGNGNSGGNSGNGNGNGGGNNGNGNGNGGGNSGNGNGNSGGNSGNGNGNSGGNNGNGSGNGGGNSGNGNGNGAGGR